MSDLAGIEKRSLLAPERICNADFRLENIMDRDFMGDRPCDLIVMNETIYYLGWPYSFFDVVRGSRRQRRETQSSHQ